MIKNILFDLDGTLLPMDQDIFVDVYMRTLSKHMLPYGYDPQLLVKSIWTGTAAMVKNDGSKTNDAAFWECFAGIFGEDAPKDEPKFEEYYLQDFPAVKKSCGFVPEAKPLIDEVKRMGYRLILATNPIFPPVATNQRIAWAGLQVEDFEFVTTYDNSHYCKPNPEYYREIFKKLDLKPEECLMVGNDVGEDMVAATLGCKVFLLTDCLINKANVDISQYPNGSYAQLLNFIKALS
ncbi:MAG: HAD family hydrolase [Ruminococcaceae bacterium]|nr:HAD family hydrolase [Oscillospiraceae bacterium]